ncbi:MAG: AAA family ATPase [Nanoarchaeota archaeon]
MIIGVTGLIGSGKGAVAEILVKKGFIKLGHSEVIDVELIGRGMTPGVRDNQIKIGNEMREKYGAGYWARKLVESIEEGHNYVVEGFRNIGEIKEFRKRKDFILLGVAAGRNRRIEWITKRGRLRDPVNFEEFLEVEMRDFLQKEFYGQQNALCFSASDRFVQNEGSLEELKNQVERFLDEIVNHNNI